VDNVPSYVTEGMTSDIKLQLGFLPGNLVLFPTGIQYFSSGDYVASLIDTARVRTQLERKEL